MENNIEAIKTGIEILLNAEIKPDVFGANEHEYILNPTLTEEEVNRFEIKYRISLSSEYRKFLIEVGNGGAGPYYGIFKLGEKDDGWDYSEWEKNDGFIG